MCSRQVVTSPPPDLRECIAEALSPQWTHSLPLWAESLAQAYAAAPSPESSHDMEDTESVIPLVERFFDLSAGVEGSISDDDSSSTE